MARWVTQIRGKYRGRTGIVDDTDWRGSCRTKKYVLVRFGNSGPSSWMQEKSVRPATSREIARQIGCRPEDLPDYLRGRDFLAEVMVDDLEGAIDYINRFLEITETREEGEAARVLRNLRKGIHDAIAQGRMT